MKISARFFLIFIFLLILLVLPVTGCTEGAVHFRATLDGKPWSGPLSFSMEAKATNGISYGQIKSKAYSSVPNGFSGVAAKYTIIYKSGGPQGADIQFSGIRYKSDPQYLHQWDTFSPSTTKVIDIIDDTEVYLDFVFVTVSEITVNATLDGDPWSGAVSYTIEGPTTESGASVTQSFGELPVGSYTITYNSGGPEDAVLKGISPSATEELSAGETTTFTLVFVSVGKIVVNATLDGDPWSGAVSYTIEGPTTESGASVTQSFGELPVGTYTVTYNSGGPPGALFCGVTPSATEELSAGETATFTLVFVSVGKIVVNATLDGDPWEGPVSYTIEGPTTESGDSVPQSFSELPVGSYTITYNSGGPPGALFCGVTPSATEELSAGETATFTLVFVFFTNGDVAAVQGSDLSVTKTVNNATPNQNDNVTYTITVTNNGPDAATNIVVTDNLPAGVTYVNDNPSQGVYNNATGLWNVGTIAAGGNATLQITAIVTAGAGATVTNTAELTSVDQADPDSTPNNDVLVEDDQDTAAFTVQSAADLRLTKAVDYPLRPQSEDIMYTITVTNDGPDVATNIVVTDNLPAGVNYVNDNPSQGAYDNATGIWNVGNIDVGNNATLQITATVTGALGLVITNTAEVTSVDQADPDSTPNNDVLAEDDQDNAVTIVGGEPD